MICRKKRINLRQKDLPRLRGFSVRNLENMRTFYEEWQMLGVNSAVATAELREKSEINEERLCQNENFGSASWLRFGKINSFRFNQITICYHKFI